MRSFKNLVPAVLLLTLAVTLVGCDQGGASTAAEPAPDKAPRPAASSSSEVTKTAADTTKAAEAIKAKQATKAAKEAATTLGADPKATAAAAKPSPKVSAAATGPGLGTVDPSAKASSLTRKLADSRSKSTTPSTITVTPTKLDLGEIATNDAKTGTVTLTNTGDAPKKVLDCKTSCGCTTANCQKGKVLEPGESMEVDIKLSGGARPIKLSKTVTFIVEDEDPLQLVVTAEAISYVTVTPDRLDPDKDPDGRVVLTSIDGSPFTIKSMYPPLITEFSTEPATEHVLNFSWEELKEQGHLSTKMLFNLDHPKCKKAMTLVAGRALLGNTNTKTPIAPTAKRTGVDLDLLLKDRKTEDILTLLAEGKIEINAADKAGQTPLVKAARWGNPDVIVALLDESADISLGDRIGRTPLMYACQSKNAEAVRVLLDAGADIAARDQIGNTALCWAAGFGDPESVREILEAGAEVEVSGALTGFTPLIWAAGFGDPASIKMLIDAGANLEAHDVLQGATPLMNAARTGGADNVRVLLDAKAKLEARDNEGKTTLLIAASNAGPDAALVQMLIDAGADLSARTTGGESVLDLARKRTDLRSEEVLALLEQVVAERNIDLGGGE